jgi:hypothetical protein
MRFQYTEGTHRNTRVNLHDLPLTKTAVSQQSGGPSLTTVGSIRKYTARVVSDNIPVCLFISGLLNDFQ